MSSYMTPNKNPARNHPQNSATKITRKSSENHQKGKQVRQHKALRNHTESSIHTRRFIQGLACHPVIHPSLKISHEALKLVLEKLEKIGNENDKGK
jgi:hypothetical protein